MTRGPRVLTRPGSSTSVSMVALVPARSVVAVSPPAGPGGATPPPSVSSEVIRPLDAPIDTLRTLCPAGAVHAVVEDDLSAQ